MLASTLFKTLVVAAAAVASLANAASVPRESVLGEVYIDNYSAVRAAGVFIDEAHTIWGSGDWQVVSNTAGILNEAKNVSGVLATAGVPVNRGSAVVDAPAQTIFDFLTTAEGFKIIDPLSNPEDFSKPPLADYTALWRAGDSTSKKTLKVERTQTIIPGIRPREFVVLNAVDPAARVFVSKSVKHIADPGCSKYGGVCFDAAAIPVRALNTFGLDIQPLAGSNNKKSLVRVINYADLMRGEIPVELQNQFNAQFVPDLITRMRAVYPTTV